MFCIVQQQLLLKKKKKICVSVAYEVLKLVISFLASIF